MKDFCSLASDKLELNVTINWGYKIIDFKPTYGILFSEYITQYDYWAHGDIDLIFGDLGKFLSPLIEADYDVISIQEKWTSGPFCLYKNTKEINSLFKKSSSYPEVYLTNELRLFDECSFLWKELENGASIYDIDSHQSMTYLVQKESQEGSLRTYFKTLAKEKLNQQDYVIWKDGKVVDSNEKEFILYHYIMEKKKWNYYFPKWKDVPDTIYFDYSGPFQERSWNNSLLKSLIHIFRYVQAAITKSYSISKNFVVNSLLRNSFYFVRKKVLR